MLYCSFNVIIAYATNYLLQQGVENATTTARYGVADTQEFLHTTSLQSNHILVKNYEELTDHLELMLKGNALLACNEPMFTCIVLNIFLFVCCV